MIILMIYLIGDTQDGSTALHYAVMNGHYDCVQLLIQSGADVDIKDNVSTLYVHIVYYHIHTHDISYCDTQDGDTALHYAVSNGHNDCAQLLIQAGAVVDIQDNVSTLYVHTVYHHDHTHDIYY